MITLSASDIDALKIAAFVAAFFINRQAGYILALHMLWELLFIVTPDGFTLSCLAAVLYLTAAASNIRIKSEIRQALWLLGCLYWLSALDYYLSDAVTYFYTFFPHLINAADLFILYHLISRSGKHAGVPYQWSGIVNNRRFRL